VYFNHHYTLTPEEAVRDVLRAGTDIDCGGFVSTYAQSALDKGLITEDDVDERLRHSLRVRMRLSHFDPLGPLDKIPTSAICSAESLATAREGARQGAVLIKNEAGTLPFPSGASASAASGGVQPEPVGSVAVIGPNINLSKSVAGYYGGNSCNGTYHTMIDAVRQYCTDVRAAKGVDDPKANATTQGVAAAAATGAAADRVVLVVGTDLAWAREGHDAESLRFSTGTIALVTAVAAAAKRPVVAVVMTATLAVGVKVI
jgi:beta-glucosidase-like glycosyl hydrolase